MADQETNASFAVDFATLAREIAQDIFPIDQIVSLHRLTDEEWQRVQSHPKFQTMLADMTREWNSAQSTRERVKLKAQTGLESQLEILVADVGDGRIPLSQRTETAKFLARIGELDGALKTSGTGERVVINIFSQLDKPPVVIDAQPVKRLEQQLGVD